MPAPGLASNVAAIVLAAGASTRFGKERNKLTEDMGGKPMVAHAVDAFAEAGIESIFVVLGFEADDVERALADRAYHPIRNPDWASGMGGSLACGIRSLPENRFEGTFVAVADLPEIAAPPIRALLRQFESRAQDASGIESTHRIVVPVHAGRRGHPVLFGEAYFDALGRLEGDQGGKPILAAHPDSVIEVAIDSDSILRDVDTPEDLLRARKR